MNIRPVRTIIAALALACLACVSPSQTLSGSHPNLSRTLPFSGYVVDQAKLLTANERQQLTTDLGRFQQQTAHQLAVVTVSSLDGEDVAIFTRRLANRWGVGRKGFDDGIVVLVAPNEHTVRIEIGRGLEHSLTNAFCATVIKTRMLPAFKAGRLGGGIKAGVTAIITRARASGAATK